MGDELDLERGDPSRADDSGERRRRRREQRASSSDKPDGKTRSESKVDTEITSRIDRVLDRIAKALDARDDEELAEVIREDGPAMGQGLVSLTSSFTFLRIPLLMFLNLIEPLLAFGRVTRILVRRWMERRVQKQWEREQAAAGIQYDENGQAVNEYGQPVAVQ